MFILDHAKDIWYIVLSLCAVTFTFFLAAFVYYLVLAAKEIKEAAAGIKRQVDALEEIIQGFRAKIAAYVSYAAVAGQIAAKIADFLKKEGVSFGKGKKASGGRPRRGKHDAADDFLQEEL